MLRHLGATGGRYLTNVQLPHGVQITKMGFYWDDSDAAFVSFFLYEREPGNSTSNYSIGIYSGDDGKGNTSVTISNFDTWIVDNNQYIYTLYVYFSGFGPWFHGGFIEYAFPT